jgi:predicted nucleic acid-binding Zn ribbon protein
MSGPGGAGPGPAEGGPDLARAALAAARTEARARGADSRRAGRAKVRRPWAGTTRSGSGPDDRDPQLLGSALGRLVAERGWEQPVAVGGVIGRWADIVGTATAEHVRAESIEDGVVTVVCDSTAWATEMRLLAPTLVRRLNEELGDGTVTRVKVVGPSAPSWRKGPLRVEGRGPRDTYG